MTRGANVMFEKKKKIWMKFDSWSSEKDRKYDRTERARSQAVFFFFPKGINSLKKKKFT